MVNKNNKRVMITFTPKQQQKADELLEVYEMTLTQLVRYLIDKEFQERSKR